MYVHCTVALFETTASAASGCFNNCVCFAKVLRASDERTEPETESKSEVGDSKRATVGTKAVSELATSATATARARASAILQH